MFQLSQNRARKNEDKTVVNYKLRRVNPQISFKFYTLSRKKSFKLSKDLIFKRIGKDGFKRKHYLVFRKSDKEKKYINDFISNFKEQPLVD